MAEKTEYVFDMLRDAGRVMQETARTLEGVQKTLENVVIMQRENAEKLKGVTALVETANAAIARANGHIARTRELLQQGRSASEQRDTLPAQELETQDEYLAKRSGDALAAVQCVARIIEDAKTRIADAGWMRDALARIRTEHHVVRSWLDEVAYDAPQSQEAAGNVRRNLYQLEATFATDIEHAVTLTPFKDLFAETERRMHEIIAGSASGNEGT